MKYDICVAIAILAVSLGQINALSEENKNDLRKGLFPHLAECAKDLGIETATLNEAKEKGTFEGIDKCLFACVFKKGEFMKDGKFLADKAIENSNKYSKTEEDIKTHTEVINECAAAANSATVSDGDAGCDRAKLVADCFLKNKQKLLGNK